VGSGARGSGAHHREGGGTMDRKFAVGIKKSSAAGA